jgi:hypothetical protein
LKLTKCVFRSCNVWKLSTYYRITGNFCGVKFLRFWSKKKTFNFCGFYFLRIENLKWRPLEIFQCWESFRDIIIYPYINFWWYRTMLNFCSIVVAILKIDHLKTIHAMFALNWLTAAVSRHSFNIGHYGKIV